MVFYICCSMFVYNVAYSFSSGAATEVPVLNSESVQDGDIISFTTAESGYVRASVENEENIFGVVVFDPAVLSRDGETIIADGTTLLPVVRTGEASVNVSDIYGQIVKGDIVGISTVLGFGGKIDREKSGYMVGVATGDAEWVGKDENERMYGKVKVALQIGPYIPDAQMESNGSGSTGEAAGTEGGGGGFDENKNNAIFDILQLFRYTIGSIMALVSVIIAVRKLGELFSQGIISIGRNPLAKAQIHSILFWNSVLILLLSGVGFLIGVAIIFFA